MRTSSSEALEEPGRARAPVWASAENPQVDAAVEVLLRAFCANASNDAWACGASLALLSDVLLASGCPASDLAAVGLRTRWSIGQQKQGCIQYGCGGNGAHDCTTASVACWVCARSLHRCSTSCAQGHTKQRATAEVPKQRSANARRSATPVEKSSTCATCQRAASSKCAAHYTSPQQCTSTMHSRRRHCQCSESPADGAHARVQRSGGKFCRQRRHCGCSKCPCCGGALSAACCIAATLAGSAGRSGAAMAGADKALCAATDIPRRIEDDAERAASASAAAAAKHTASARADDAAAQVPRVQHARAAPAIASARTSCQARFQRAAAAAHGEATRSCPAGAATVCTAASQPRPFGGRLVTAHDGAAAKRVTCAGIRRRRAVSAVPAVPAVQAAVRVRRRCAHTLLPHVREAALGRTQARLES